MSAWYLPEFILLDAISAGNKDSPIGLQGSTDSATRAAGAVTVTLGTDRLLCYAKARLADAILPSRAIRIAGDRLPDHACQCRKRLRNSTTLVRASAVAAAS
jgi:hypothetical protein